MHSTKASEGSCRVRPFGLVESGGPGLEGAELFSELLVSFR